MTGEHRNATRRAGGGFLVTLGLLGAILAMGTFTGALLPAAALWAAALMIVSLSLAAIGAAVCRWGEGEP